MTSRVQPKAFGGPRVPPGIYVGLKVSALSVVAWPARQARVPQFGSSRETKEFRDRALTSWGEFDGISKMLQSYSLFYFILVFFLFSFKYLQIACVSPMPERL